MKKLIILPVLFLTLMLSGCATKYSEEQVNSLIQQEKQSNSVEITKLQDQINELKQNTSTEPTQISTSTEQTNTSNDNQPNVSTKTYKNIKSGYLVDYPTNWQSPVISGLGDSNFEIQNIKDVYSAGPGNHESIMSNNASIVSILVDTSLNGISYANYKTIDDVIKDPKFISPSAVQSKLSFVSSMNIGGKKLRVSKVVGDVSQNYGFIYNGKHYSINFNSGSKSQYSADSETFNNLLSSFTLL